MAPAEIPDDVRRFVARHIDSVGLLEVLLLVRSHPERAWTAEAMAKEMRMDAAWAAEQLRALVAARVLVESDAAYRYAPRRAEIGRVVDDLASTFAARRVAVITLIASQPNRRIQNFTDAFRLRRSDDDG